MSNLISTFIRTLVKALVDGLVKRRHKRRPRYETAKKQETPVTRRSGSKSSRVARRTTRRRG